MDLHDLAKRVQLGIRRKQVVLGRDKLFNLGKRELVGLVWATEELSRRAAGKLPAAAGKLPAARDRNPVGYSTETTLSWAA